MDNQRISKTDRKTLRQASWLIRIGFLLASADCQMVFFLTHARQAWLLALALLWFVLAFVLPLDVPRRSALLLVLATWAAVLLSVIAFLLSGTAVFLIALACNLLVFTVTVLLVFRK